MISKHYFIFQIQKDLLKLQMSAVLSQMILRIDSSNKFLDNLISSFEEIIDTKYLKQVKQCYIELDVNKDYIKNYWSKVQSKENRKVNFEKEKCNMYVAVHSLSLHLQAALSKLHALENKCITSQVGCGLYSFILCFIFKFNFKNLTLKIQEYIFLLWISCTLKKNNKISQYN